MIPIFAKLFKTNQNKKVSEWEIKILKKGEIYTIVTTHGDVDGKKISHEKDITEGKVKRTILEQATQDAKRKWQNKKEKELYNEEISTLKSIIVRPMLANTFSFELYKMNKRSFKISFPAYVQRKYDGIRCISYLKDGEVIIESRKGIPFQNFQLLKIELKELLKKMPQNFYFDGELYTDKLDFETLSGLIRLHEKTCTEKDISLINIIDYHIYDFIDTNNLSMIYKERHAILNDVLKKNKCKYVETFIVETLKDVKTYHDDFVKDGYEGVMIRDMNGPYEINKRSKYLQKFKEFMDDEFTIVGFHEGTGDEKGTVIWDCKTNENKLFAVRPKGTTEIRKKLFDTGNEYIGKLLTVIFQEYSADGIPRFPVGKGIREETH